MRFFAGAAWGLLVLGAALGAGCRGGASDAFLPGSASVRVDGELLVFGEVLQHYETGLGEVIRMSSSGPRGWVIEIEIYGPGLGCFDTCSSSASFVLYGPGDENYFYAIDCTPGVYLCFTDFAYDGGEKSEGTFWGEAADDSGRVLVLSDGEFWAWKYSN